MARPKKKYVPKGPKGPSKRTQRIIDSVPDDLRPYCTSLMAPVNELLRAVAPHLVASNGKEHTPQDLHQAVTANLPRFCWFQSWLDRGQIPPSELLGAIERGGYCLGPPLLALRRSFEARYQDLQKTHEGQYINALIEDGARFGGPPPSFEEYLEAGGMLEPMPLYLMVEHFAEYIGKPGSKGPCRVDRWTAEMGARVKAFVDAWQLPATCSPLHLLDFFKTKKYFLDPRLIDLVKVGREQAEMAAPAVLALASAAPTLRNATVAAEDRLVREPGGAWRVTTAQGPDMFFTHAEGFPYLRLLLGNPGACMDAATLNYHPSASTSGDDRELLTNAGESRQNVLDPAAKRAAEDAIASLKSQRDAAQSEEERERLSEQVVGWESKLRQVTRSGRTRDFRNEEQGELKRIQKAVKRAIDDIMKVDPLLGLHLRSSVKQNDWKLSYNPNPPRTWTTD